jgi:hypothetical protein
MTRIGPLPQNPVCTFSYRNRRGVCVTIAASFVGRFSCSLVQYRDTAA